jgi:hypothetical protein
MRLGLLAVGFSLGLALASVAEAQPAVTTAETTQMPAPVGTATDNAPSRRPIALGLIAALFLVMGAVAVVNDKFHDRGKPKSRRF